jgi:hypothetical protein
MHSLASFGTKVAALGALGMMCTGCPNPNTYGTPRTTPVGKLQHTVAAEGIGAAYKVPEVTPGTDAAGNPTTRVELVSHRYTLPNSPTYQLRVGVADDVDIGVKFANLSSLGADVKWNFIKGDTFDMAAAPGFQVMHFSVNGVGFTQFYGNLPLLFGINVDDSVTLVPTAGVTYSASSDGVISDAASYFAPFSQGGLWLRGGLGVNFRISPKFALQPEVTFLKNFAADDEIDSLTYVFGLGFNFGNLPVYGGGGPAE